MFHVCYMLLRPLFCKIDDSIKVNNQFNSHIFHAVTQSCVNVTLKQKFERTQVILNTSKRALDFKTRATIRERDVHNTTQRARISVILAEKRDTVVMILLRVLSRMS